MQANTKISLDASEIAGLWTSYIDDGLEVCVMKYFLNKVKDNKIRPVIEQALNAAQDHVNTVRHIYGQEGLPIPHGFGDDDVDINSPELFSDEFYLFYLFLMATAGMKAYSFLVGQSVREDIRGYFQKCQQDSTNTFNYVTNVMLAKGLLVRPPIVEVAKDVDFVEKKSFLAGILSEPRSLVVHEIMYMHACFMRNIISRKLVSGFAKAAESEEIMQYMSKGIDMFTKHVEQIGNKFSQEGIQIPSITSMYIKDSTKLPFSDRLMLQRVLAVNAYTLSDNNDALTSSFRTDLQAMFAKISADLAIYNKNGIDIMMKNGWLEQPPQLVDKVRTHSV